MSRFIISLLAKQELKEINRYIARFNSNAARRLINRIKQQCKLLADFPEMGQKCDELEPDLRSFPVENYMIFYRPKLSLNTSENVLVRSELQLINISSSIL